MNDFVAAALENGDQRLPSGWEWASLDELGCWLGGGTPSTDNQAFWTGGTIPWVSPKDMKVARIADTQDHITEQAVRASAASVVPTGAVLIVTRSGILRHSLPVAVLSVDAALNQDLKALVLSDGLDSEYVAAALRAFAGDILKRCTKHGTTVHSVEFPRLKGFCIPLAPTNEQRRIVAKVEELLSQLDAGVANLRRARALLGKYRRAVLKAAVTGELTREWREKQRASTETGAELLRRILRARREAWEAAELTKMRAKRRISADDQWEQRYNEPKSVDITDVPGLPDGWVWASFDALIGDGPTNGYSPKAGADASGTWSLKLTATTSGHLSLDRNAIKRLYEEIPACSDLWLKSGDILIQRANSIDHVGISAIYTAADGVYIYPDLMMRVRLVCSSLTHWVWRVLNSPYGRSYFKSKAIGTAGSMPKINAQIVREFPIPLPPLEEAGAAVDFLDNISSFIDQNAEAMRIELKRSTALRQSILTSAFRGQLVPQDPHDEPASILLERIRAERKAKPKPARGPRRGAEAGGRQLELPG